jgi:hypothetical protein
MACLRAADFPFLRRVLARTRGGFLWISLNAAEIRRFEGYRLPLAISG